MMEAQQISETLVFNSPLTWLITQKDFRATNYLRPDGPMILRNTSHV
jgi:hypothetical protein